MQCKATWRVIAKPIRSYLSILTRYVFVIIPVAECLSKISELEMEVSSKEEANARLQAKHIEEVAALATDIKGLKVTIIMSIPFQLKISRH